MPVILRNMRIGTLFSGWVNVLVFKVLFVFLMGVHSGNIILCVIILHAAYTCQCIQLEFVTHNMRLHLFCLPVDRENQSILIT